MTEKQEELFKRLNELDNSIKTFSDKEYHPIFSKRIFWTSQEYLSNLLNHLDEELNWFSKLFYAPKNTVFVLAIIIKLYIKYDGIKTNFITYKDIESELYLYRDNHYIFELRDAIFDLEEKGIIEISDVEHYLIRVFNKADRRENDYFLIPAKPTFVPFGNKKFELSNSFINKLYFL